MKNFYRLCCGSFLLLIFTASLLLAGNGKIAGVVKDKDGKPIIGVTIMLEGTKMGAAADIEGRYFVLNIPPGKYDVAFTAVGYKKRVVRDFSVSSDVTRDLNISLEEQAVQVGEIIVEAERKLVDKNLTSTRTTISTDELSNTLPVASTYEILQTAPSVYKGFIRGGRQGQTKSIIEGVDISDQFYAVAADQSTTPYATYNALTRYDESQQSQSLTVNSNAISEMTVNTGALGSEYASATAGVISYSLKEGKGPITGKAYFRSSTKRLTYMGTDLYGDDSLYFNEKTALLNKKTHNDSLKANRYTYTRGRYDLGEPSIEGNLSLSGAITDDIGFFLSSNLLNNTTARLPNSSFRESNTLLKMTFNPTSNIKVTAFGILDDRGKLFGWKNTNYSDVFRFYLNGVPVKDGLGWTGSAKLTHFLAANTFYEVQISNVFKEDRAGFCDANGDGLIGIDKNGNFDFKDMTTGDFIQFNDTTTNSKYISSTYNNPATTRFFSPAPANEADCEAGFTGIGGSRYNLNRPGPFYQDLRSNTMTAKLDFTSQINFNHQIKAGASFSFHDINNKTQAGFIGGYEWAFAIEQYHVFPKEIAAYVSDRMEYAGLVINAGLRADMFGASVADYANYWKPYKLDSLYDAQDALYVSVLTPNRLSEDVKARWYISPRLAVSHPVSDNANIYFSFAKVQQPQDFSKIYTDLNQITNLSNAVVDLVSRAPIISTKYEFGGAWQFMDKIAVNVSAYYNNMENYVTAAYQVNERAGISPPTFIVYFNSGYADARGIELQLDVLQHDISDFMKISGRLTYSYSFLSGSAIVSPEYGNIVKTGFTSTDSAAYGGQLPFDTYKTFTRIEAPIVAGTSALTGGYNRAHRVGYTLFMRFPYDISLTSIGTFQSGFYYTAQFSDPRTQGREFLNAPWCKQIDIRIEKAFIFANKYRLAAFLDVKNLFNSKNILAYDNTTTYSDKWETSQDPTGLRNRVIGPDGTLFYDIPREIYFGVSLDF